jgi:hypothetical protein
MTETEKAAKIVGDLEVELENLTGRTNILEKQQQEISFAARTGDRNARAKLDKINSEIATNDNEIKIIASALIEAKSRLGSAEQVEALEADRKKALQIQELQKAFIERLLAIDDACEDIAKCTQENKVLLSEIHRLGVTAPSHDSVRINSILALKTMLMGCPWNVQEYEGAPHFLAPNEKKYFKNLAEAWDAQIGNQIVGRLPPNKEAA